MTLGPRRGSRSIILKRWPSLTISEYLLFSGHTNNIKMSADASTLPISPATSGNTNAVSMRRIAKRQPLSCRACRQHKLRCDRQVPCSTCIRYHREAHCRQNPAPVLRQQRTAAPQNGSSHQERQTPACVTEPAGVPAIRNGRLSSNEVDEVHSIRQTVESVYMATAARHMRPQTSRGQWALDGCSSWATVIGYIGSEGDSDTNPIPLPFVLSGLYRSGNDDCPLLKMPSPQNRQVFWRHQLVAMLPTRSQCDILLTYYVEHINWLFQTVHVPSFRCEYARFWDGDIPECDLIWLSLLFTIISLSALYIPLEMTEIVGLPREAVRNLAHGWHLASQRALQAGEYDAKPCLRQLQTFSVTQLYWYATNNIEILNS
jgi:hypothetical protein